MDQCELVRAALFGFFAKAGPGAASRICLYDLHEAVRLRGAPCPRLVLDLMVVELLLNGMIKEITDGELNDATCVENLYIIPDHSLVVPGSVDGEDAQDGAGTIDDNGSDGGDDEKNFDWPEGRVSE